ncbi:hypothetical protein BKA82DRAFT_4011221 [Pisolithus tinctorius]|nr:hypothetical protein BKA82DRAFT_4011221 [Pisolithus tinctorius]
MGRVFQVTTKTLGRKKTEGVIRDTTLCAFLGSKYCPPVTWPKFGVIALVFPLRAFPYLRATDRGLHSGNGPEMGAADYIFLLGNSAAGSVTQGSTSALPATCVRYVRAKAIDYCKMGAIGASALGTLALLRLLSADRLRQMPDIPISSVVELCFAVLNRKQPVGRRKMDGVVRDLPLREYLGVPSPLPPPFESGVVSPSTTCPACVLASDREH